ncbi:MAG TPA: TPM domain-containing protein [Thermoanaerobaculia bacterium]
MALVAVLIAAVSFSAAVLVIRDVLSPARNTSVAPVSATGGPVEPPSSLPAAPTRWLTDTVGFLSKKAAKQLDSTLHRYERETGHQVIVWIGDSTHGRPLEDYTLRMFNAWGVGRKGVNDGVAFFVFSMDHKVRLEVGSGLVKVLPDSTAAAVLHEVVLPRVARGENDEALLQGVTVTLRLLGGEQWKSLEGAFKASFQRQ